ncbi:hypothetical protein, partial [Streptomyces aureus]|uniref:hypothetical protein n=1 Tax=Streptomyces aureus TaxID=193461 RepID=UPI001C1F4CE5
FGQGARAAADLTDSASAGRPDAAVRVNIRLIPFENVVQHGCRGVLFTWPHYPSLTQPWACFGEF